MDSQQNVLPAPPLPPKKKRQIQQPEDFWKAAREFASDMQKISWPSIDRAPPLPPKKKRQIQQPEDFWKAAREFASDMQKISWPSIDRAPPLPPKQKPPLSPKRQKVRTQRHVQTQSELKSTCETSQESFTKEQGLIETCIKVMKKKALFVRDEKFTGTGGYTRIVCLDCVKAGVWGKEQTIDCAEKRCKHVQKALRAEPVFKKLTRWFQRLFSVKTKCENQESRKDPQNLKDALSNGAYWRASGLTISLDFPRT